MQLNLEFPEMPLAPGSQRVLELRPKLRPNGLFPNDQIVTRPPQNPITHLNTEGHGKRQEKFVRTKGKDTKFYVNVFRELGTYVREHNPIHANNPHMQ